MSKNYIVINDQKIELSEEQIKQMSRFVDIPKKNPFKNYQDDFMYPYCIDSIGNVYQVTAGIEDFENVCNAFYDKAFAHQVALHQLLYRKLLKYGYDNNIIDQSEWDGRNYHYFVVQDSKGFYRVRERLTERLLNTVYFNSEDAIYKVIENVILPFQKEYPEFNW